MYQVILGILDISISIVGAFLMAALVPSRIRDRYVPWAFAYMLWWLAAGSTFMPMVNIHLYRLMFILYFLLMGLVLSNFKFSAFRQNGAWNGFAVFIIYFMLSGLQGIGTFGESIEYYFKLLRLLIVGFLVGKWMMSQSSRGADLIMATTVAAAAAAFLYLIKGSWDFNALSDAGGRMVVDTSEMLDSAGSDADTVSIIKGKFNVNLMALKLSMIMPYPFLMIMYRLRGRYCKVFEVGAVFSLIVLSLMLFRTGSRNGATVFVALGWFFVFAKTNISASKKWLIVCGMSIIIAVLVARSIRGFEFRSFDFNREGATNLYEFGNGRGAMLVNAYERMTPTQHVFGAGIPWNAGGIVDPITGKRQVANCHSIYVQVFEQSGYLGLLLLLAFALAYYCSAKMAGRRGSVALLFFYVYLLTGIGEAANLMGNGYAILGLGIGLALCGKEKGRQYDIFNNWDQMLPIYRRWQKV